VLCPRSREFVAKITRCLLESTSRWTCLSKVAEKSRLQAYKLGYCKGLDDS
jgi:hypothetical protein